MSVEPYSTAQRVFVVVDNGSAHRGQRSIDRLQGAWPNLILVHTPVHASWLNQAEIYFSVAQRKVLQPNNFPDLDTLEQTLLAFGRHYEQIAQPFEWKFTRKDLQRVLERLDQPTPRSSSPRDPQIRQRTCEDDHLTTAPRRLSLIAQGATLTGLVPRLRAGGSNSRSGAPGPPATAPPPGMGRGGHGASVV